MRGRFWRLAAYTFLSGTAILVATLLFLVPGISLACRLITALPAATVENLGPGEAFGRSFRLTRDYSWRGLVIYLLYSCLRLAAFALLFYPQRLASVLARSDPTTATVWLALISAVLILEATLIGPFLTIAATVFYFDLRVRKEAWDLQVMLNTEREMPPVSP
jgi:Membrane domain of glycerophosphoryl diester phosphodiesterase